MFPQVLPNRSPTLVAALGAAIVLAACSGPGASVSSEVPTSQPTTGTPTASASATATPAPSAVPATWSSLAWTRVDKTFVFSLAGVRGWAGGYVGIGQVWDTEDQPTTAFFTSTDGLTWQVAQRLTPGEGLTPRWLLTTGDGLLAVVNVLDASAGQAYPHLWQSTDGRSWQELSSPGWQAAWTSDRRLLAIAGGPTGLVAVGSGPDGAFLTFSPDAGRTWQVGGLQAGAGGEARSVVGTVDGFVTVGAVDGQWDATSRAMLGGHPAAWTSSDGLTWNAAQIQPATNADRLTFTEVYAAADGLIAVATDTSGSVPGATAQAWASADGNAWQPLGAVGQVVPRGSLAADGTRLLILDPGSQSPDSATPWPGYLSGWTSLDGRTWTPVSFSGQLMDQESFDGWWLTGTGLIFSGTQQVWLGAAD